jgi:hypothetical protein
MVEFKIKNSQAAEKWCIKHISPRVYYLHNVYGGNGWRVIKKYPGTFLCIEDDKKALVAMLTLENNNG